MEESVVKCIRKDQSGMLSWGEEIYTSRNKTNEIISCFFEKEAGLIFMYTYIYKWFWRSGS